MPTIRPVSAVPTFASPEEHKAILGSTPASFDSIPPVLYHKEENVSVILNPPLEGLQDVRGTLYVIQSALVFMSDGGTGFEIKYPSIILHAVSRAESGPCIYCQLETDDPEEEEMNEISIFPGSETALEPIFEALTTCAALHPGDPDETEDDKVIIDTDFSGFEVFTGDEGEELSEVGRAALEHLESVIEDPQGLVNDVKLNGYHESPSE